MVTLKQIAAACGISVATVSKALNHAPDIGAETAEKVRQTARELGYYPNSAARALKTNRTYNIGVLFDDDTHVGLTHEYFSHILNAVKNAAESRGYDVTFISSRVESHSMGYLEHCKYRNVDGVVIANVDFRDAAVQELLGSDIPLVTIDYPAEGHSAVISDNERSMRELLEYVYSMGHRRIAYISGEATAVTGSRMDSFRITCQRLGLEIPAEYLINAKYHDPKSSGRATRQLLKLHNRPTCILYPDDISILGGMTEIEKQGLKIPEDISIVGFDGIPLCQVLRPRLTTLHQDSQTLGFQAATLLIDEIESPKALAPRVLMVPGHVLPGQTVKRL